MLKRRHLCTPRSQCTSIVQFLQPFMDHNHRPLAINALFQPPLMGWGLGKCPNWYHGRAESP